MKKIFAVLLAVLTAACSLCACGDDGHLVYVESVEAITGTGYTGMSNRYSGVVVSGSTSLVYRDLDKKIEELRVEVGDRVEAGDLLFSYDLKAVQLSVKKLELEIEQLENSLKLLADNIKDCKKLVSSNTGAKKLEYEVQLQSYQIEEKENTLELSGKKADLEEAKGMLVYAHVTSRIDGVVQSINEENAGQTDENGDVIPYITVIETGAFRVEGVASELDVNSIFEGGPVIVRSRVDDTTWNGTVEYIEWDNPQQEQQNQMYYTDTENAASRYPFHVVLDSTDGLILGQHVYIEPATMENAGMQLPDYYILDADVEGGAYVWAANSRDRVEKRTVELGAYNELTMCYEIISGLEPDDYIAFPDGVVEEGMKVTYSYEDMMTEDTSWSDVASDGDMFFGEDIISGGDIFFEDNVVFDETEALG